jgi:hypothetical protein
MSGIFPNINDGGLAPSDDPLNPTHAFPPTIPPNGTVALYYGNGCDVRLRPEVLNSIISELTAIVDRAEIAYNPGSLQNCELAIRYLVQRGLMSGCTLTAGPVNYNGAMTPRATRYNDFMTIRVVPNVTNTGAAFLSLDGLGYAPILRNDGQVVRNGDLVAGFPLILIFYQGNWYKPDLARSQVPQMVDGAVDVWIRTDGNDLSGDGSANTADKAFRTINGAWARVNSRFAQSPSLQINLRLGIPGTYAGGYVGRFSGTVQLIGDVNNKAAYQIVTDPNSGASLEMNCPVLYVYGVTLIGNVAMPQLHPLRIWNGSTCVITTCDLEIQSQAPGNYAEFIYCIGNCDMVGNLEFRGNNRSVDSILFAGLGGIIGITGGGTQVRITYRDIISAGAGYQARSLSQISVAQNPWAAPTPNILTTISNCTGPTYAAVTLSQISGGGQPLPGNAAGSVTESSYFHA